jgi:hypothetical protein
MLAIREMILRRLLTALINEKGKVTVDSDHGYDEEAKSFTNVDEAIKEAFEYDEVWLMVGGSFKEGYDAWVYIIFGNGNCDLDMISNYSVSLEPIVEPIMEWIEGLQDGSVKLTTND